MLFMVISTPRPEPPSKVASARRKFWIWFNPMLADGQAKWIYARPGRGAVALFDTNSHEHLHRLLGAWAELIPATFEIHPLIDAQAAQAHLAGP
jgi:muconolactone delta-isomerase